MYLLKKASEKLNYNTNERMKILIISQYYKPDPFRLNELAEGLVERGHDVTVLSGTPNYTKTKQPDSENNKGVSVVRVPTVRRNGGTLSLALSYFSYMIFASFKALTLRTDYDIVLIYQLSPILMAVPGLIYGKKNKRKVALYCLDLWPESFTGNGITHDSMAYRIIRKISISIYNKVDGISMTSEMFEEYFKNDLKLKHKFYNYIPQFGEDIYSSITKKEHEGINFLFAGNIGEAQSVETIVRAAQYVNDDRIKWHIVGDGSNYQRCVNLANECGVENKVFFYGRKPKEDMPAFYEMADVLLVTLNNNPIISYTLPGKVQSYMAAGLPILASAMGETKNTIEKAKCGMCCEPNNPEELAKLAIKMVSSDLNQLGRNAKQYYTAHFSKDIFFENIESFLKNIVQD